jgi:hypothetical protein
MAALERMRGLAQSLESLEARVRDGQAGGASGQGEASGAGATGQPAGPRQLQRELRERVREADALGRDLGDGPPGGTRGPGERASGPSASGALRDVRRLDDARLVADPKALAELLASVSQGLKSAEFALRRDVQGPDREKLFLSGSQDLPPGWQAMVEEYYRSLARKPGGGGR